VKQMRTEARKIADSPLEWVSGSGDSSGIILSSRVRLARNLEDHIFPWRASREEMLACEERIRSRILSENSLRSFRVFEIDQLDPLARGVMIERHLISPSLAKGGPGRGTAVDDRGIVSILVNEEDHLRIQAFLGGLRLHEAWRVARQIDQILEDLVYAFDSRIGFLTTCPTNIGTGLRASVMIHLPALSVLRKVGKVASDCGRIGLTVRGMFGEGSDSAGSLFQVSNQVTLGQTEEELIEKVSGVAAGLVRQEQAARDRLLSEKRSGLEDKAWRAWGLLRFSRNMGIREALELVSLARMGSETGVLPKVPSSTWNLLLMDIQKAHIQARAESDLTPEELDSTRSGILREAFGPFHQTGQLS